MMTRPERGMSLIELMIVVVIIGILAAIAYPSYRAYVERSKRSEARAALLQVATNQERVYLNTSPDSSYTNDMRELGFPSDPYTTDSGAYVVDVDDADANSYTAVATYQDGGDEADRCLTFTITAAGAKTSGPEPDCWTANR